MDPDYHSALLGAQFSRLESVARAEWPEISVARQGALIYVGLERLSGRARASYRARIDAARYPVEPYRLGFIDPSLQEAEWAGARDRDPRNWPYSQFPGLQGSFNIIFAGPFRTFWCRACTEEYFYYHGEAVWDPAAWPIDRVVSHLREAVQTAEHPAQWRPLQVPLIHEAARARGIELPAHAGVGNA